MNLSRHLVAVLALLTSGVMFYFGTGLLPLWWLSWIAPNTRPYLSS